MIIPHETESCEKVVFYYFHWLVSAIYIYIYIYIYYVYIYIYIYIYIYQFESDLMMCWINPKKQRQFIEQDVFPFLKKSLSTVSC